MTVGAGVTLGALAEDPHPVLARLRESEPVSWLPVLDGWLVTRYDLASDVMRDAATFTVDDPRFSTSQVVGPSMLSLDGAEHARHREPFTHPFKPGQVRRRFAGFVERAAERLVAELKSNDNAELRTAYAGPLAVATMAEALGLVDVDPATVMGWYAHIVEAVTEVTAGRPIGLSAREAVTALSTRVRPEVDGDLSEDEIVSNAAVLLFGGIDTTEGAICNAVLHLLGSGEPLSANAIEESMRLEPAAAVVDRYATRDVELAGAGIKRGDLVRVSITGANRDPAVFADPDRFDPRRENARTHLAFAVGPHFCLGAQLARTEIMIAVRTLFERLPYVRIDRPAAPRGLVFRKPPELHVRWD
jgi:cytochrome P450